MCIPACAIPSPWLPSQSCEAQPVCAAATQGTRALERTALPSPGPTPASAREPRPSQGCAVPAEQEGSVWGREGCHDPQLVLQRDTRDCKLMWHPARTAALITSCCAELWCTPSTSDGQALGESPLLGKGTGQPGVDMKEETILPSHQRSSTNVMVFAEKHTCK